MITIHIDGSEFFNSKTNEFYEVPDSDLRLEFSLAAISKWESITHKSFFTKNGKSKEEYILLIKCMDLDSDDRSDLIYTLIGPSDLNKIAEYMNDPMSARKAYKDPKQKSAQFMTSEDIYYQMFYNGLPLECENWHFNKLVSVLKLCNIRNQAAGGKKMSVKDQYAMYADLNNQRRKALHSKG